MHDVPGCRIDWACDVSTFLHLTTYELLQVSHSFLPCSLGTVNSQRYSSSDRQDQQRNWVSESLSLGSFWRGLRESVFSKEPVRSCCYRIASAFDAAALSWLCGEEGGLRLSTAPTGRSCQRLAGRPETEALTENGRRVSALLTDNPQGSLIPSKGRPTSTRALPSSPVDWLLFHRRGSGLVRAVKAAGWDWLG